MSWMYGAEIPDSLDSITNPSVSTRATTSSSVSSTLPGSAIPGHDVKIKVTIRLHD